MLPGYSLRALTRGATAIAQEFFAEFLEKNSHQFYTIKPVPSENSMAFLLCRYFLLVHGVRHGKRCFCW